MGTFWIVLAVIELFVIIAGLVVWLLGKKKNDAMVDNARKLAKGKLNIDDIPTSGNNSSEDVIASGLNLIKSNLLTFVESTKQNTVVLSDAIDRLTDGNHTVRIVAHPFIEGYINLLDGTLYFQEVAL